MASGVKMSQLREIEILARLHTERAIEKLAQLMDSAESEAVQLQAADKLLDRGWGKARQSISVEDPSILSDEDLERTLREKLSLAFSRPSDGGGAAGSSAGQAAAGAETSEGSKKPIRLVH